MIGRQTKKPQWKERRKPQKKMLNETEEGQLSDVEFKAMVIRKLDELTENYEKSTGKLR